MVIPGGVKVILFYDFAYFFFEFGDFFIVLKFLKGKLNFLVGIGD